MLDATDFTLLNGWQRSFPLVSRPFDEIALRLGLQAQEVIARYRALAAQGALSRIGAVFRPNSVGASLLAAMEVPQADLDRVAALVSALPGVNHNYEREHALNLWFVATAADRARLEALLGTVEARSGLPVLRLPLVEEYHIDLGFDMAGEVAPRGSAPAAGPVTLDARARRLAAALAVGIPLTDTPYVALAERLGFDEATLVAMVSDWQARGTVRRFGTVVRHRALGYGANVMVVWDVPDDRVREAGRRAAALPAVTLCYRRARVLPRWPYNLFCMIHGRDRARVHDQIAAVTRQAQLAGYPRATLFSARCFKQRGAHYAAAALHG